MRVRFGHSPERPKRRRRGVYTGLPTAAEYPSQVFSSDFINAQSVGAVMQKLIEQYGPPPYIRSDNGLVPRSEATTCEAIYRNAVADLARCHEYQNYLQRTGKSLAEPIH